MSPQTARFKRYGFIMLGIVASLHLGSMYIKPLVTSRSIADISKDQPDQLTKLTEI